MREKDGERERERERKKEREGERGREKEREGERGIVAKALDGQRYPLPLCEYVSMCDGDRVGCLRMTSYRPLELAAVFYMGHGVYKWENIIGGHSRAPLSYSTSPKLAKMGQKEPKLMWEPEN